MSNFFFVSSRCFLSKSGTARSELIAAVSSAEADLAIETLNNIGEKAYKIGTIAAGEKGINLCQK